MHIHILGIAGSMTAPLALALQKQGHLITGSDQEKIYPPFSQQLKKAHISINQTEINSYIDLAIIGSSYQSFSKTKAEFAEIKKLKIPYISATNYIAKNLIKSNSILIAGSYGKTTTTAATAFLLKKAGLKPNFMFGGQSLNLLPSCQFNNSDWSVVEADESIHGLDTQAKFLYYPVKYLILTSAQWEHKDSYQNENENFLAFQNLVKNIPIDGLLIYNQNDPSILPLLSSAKCKVIPYNSTKIKNNLIGEYNQNNLAAVEILAQNLTISPKIITTAFLQFKGIKRRLQLLATHQKILFFDDFAQSANRIEATINALKIKYPQSLIKVFFEAHASFIQHPQNLLELKTAFKNCSEIVIYRLNFPTRNSFRLSAKDFLTNISHSCYLPLPKSVLDHYKNNLKSDNILIHFSSGGLEGQKLFKKIISLYS
ncbi:MAG: Mur ligase family protein [Candidatus Shapirobacteria bacterium]|jgi:UDP-N-acetylmuramate: L-alanyl-gamma-D-glutamyl-meso-diaminopimelate ligase